MSQISTERSKVISALNSGVFHLKTLARATGIDPSTIYRIRNSDSCTVKSLDRLVEYFHELKERLP
jgi:predicted transcriptional regulator